MYRAILTDKTVFDSGISDDILGTAERSIQDILNDKKLPRKDKSTLEVLYYIVMFMRHDHKKINNFDAQIKYLKQRNIITWIEGHPKVSIGIIALIVIDYWMRYGDTIKAWLGIK